MIVEEYTKNICNACPDKDSRCEFRLCDRASDIDEAFSQGIQQGYEKAKKEYEDNSLKIRKE